MENVVLTVHLILALSLIGVVLMQRSEGGGLGMGGGGGAISGRAAATALGKITWGLAIAFIATSLTLTILEAQKTDSGSVLDRISESSDPAALDADNLAPPPATADGDEQPLVPKAD